MGAHMRHRVAADDEHASLDVQLGVSLRLVIREEIARAFREERERAPANLTRLPARSAVESPVEQPSWVTIKKAAALSSYNERTIRRYLANGSLKGSGLRGGRIMMFELERWMAEMATHKQPVNADGDADDEVNSEVDRLLNNDE
jgi:hypothetical protein